MAAWLYSRSTGPRALVVLVTNVMIVFQKSMQKQLFLRDSNITLRLKLLTSALSVIELVTCFLLMQT
eukprot:COSAG01_NODE_6099_length_3850_cov_3.542789_5_plen_67_part_00